MVDWLSDTMPLRVSDEECAVLMRAGTTQWASHCAGVAVVEVRWQFHDGVKVLRWCADHASVLMGWDRCLQVRPLDLSGRRYDVGVEA